MQDIIEFFSGLLETGNWPARWFCGIWSDFHGWLYIISDIGIWLAYFFIPVILIWFIKKRPDLPFLPVFWLFGAFIILCGVTHLLDAVIFWYPVYRLSALFRFFTAIVSFITVYALIRDLPKLLEVDSYHVKGVEGESIIDEIAKKDQEILLLKEEIHQLKLNQQ